MFHTFDEPCYTKMEKYMKNMIAITFFNYFSFFVEQGPLKVCNMGTPWMRNQNLHPTSTPTRNLSKISSR